EADRASDGERHVGELDAAQDACVDAVRQRDAVERPVDADGDGVECLVQPGTAATRPRLQTVACARAQVRWSERRSRGPRLDGGHETWHSSTRAASNFNSRA